MKIQAKLTSRRAVSNAAFAALAALSLVPQGAKAQYDHGESNTLRIMSYNIYNGKQVDGKTFNYEQQADIIRRMNPDLTTIDEVDSMTERSKGHFAIREYANALGMHYVYSPSIPYKGGKYGMGMLAKKYPQSITRITMPGREEKRTLIIAEYPDYVFASTHFSLTPVDQLKSIDILRSEAAKYDKPFFLAGDLNCTPESEAGKYLSKYFTLLTDPKAPTFPANAPKETIDYIAVFKNEQAKNVVLLRNGVINEPKASDHRPVYADIRFAMPTDKLLYSDPYLQDFTNDAVTVMYQTNAVVHTWVEYGTDTTNLKSARTILAGQELCYDIENKVRLDSLRPGVKYYYRVCAQEVLLNEAYRKILGSTSKTQWHTFTLPAPDAKDFTAVIFNDLHEQDHVMNALYGIVKRNGIKPDMVLFNGDCVPEPQNRTHAIERVNVLMQGVDAADIPTIIIRGNHEIRNAYSAGMLSLTDNFGGKTYGAFSWGDTRFVVLDCGEDKNDGFWVYYGLNDFTKLRADQKVFLEKELKSKEFKKARRHILINHIPIWGTKDVYTDNYHPWTELWSPLIEKAKFDVNLTAHAHMYYFYEKGQQGNPMPCMGGGGPSMDGNEMGTVAVLQKSGEELRLRVFAANGKTLLDRKL